MHIRKWRMRALLALALGIVLGALLFLVSDKVGRFPLETYLIVDTSESLGDELFQALKQVACAPTRALEPGDRFLLVEVFSSVYIRYERLADKPLISGDDIGVALQQVQALQMRRGVPPGTRLDLALGLVSRESRANSRASLRRCFLVLVTDGAPDLAEPFSKCGLPKGIQIYVLGNKYPGLVGELRDIGYSAVVSTDAPDSLHGAKADLLLSMERAHRNALLEVLIGVAAVLVFLPFAHGAWLCWLEAYRPLCGVFSDPTGERNQFNLVERRQPWWRVLHPRRKVLIGPAESDWPLNHGEALVWCDCKGNMRISSTGAAAISVDSRRRIDAKTWELHPWNDWDRLQERVHIGNHTCEYFYQLP